MPKNPKEDIERRRKALEKEVKSKDWFEVIIGDIEKTKKLYSDQRIKGYVKETHERTILNHISDYIKDSDLKKLANEYLHQIRMEGERERIKSVEKKLQNLEIVLGKEAVALETKERLINHAEEEINTQIPKDIREIYTEMTSWMREKYLKK